MALPTIAAINTAVNNLYNAFADRKIRTAGRYSVGLLNKIFVALKDQYTPDADFVVSDAADADIAAFFAGGLTTGLGKAPAVGDIFQVGGTGDTTDNALEAAKASAVVDGDIFQVSNIGGGSESVTWLGLAGSITTSDNETADFTA